MNWLKRMKDKEGEQNMKTKRLYRLRALVLASLVAFCLGLAADYAMVSPELNVYRTAGFWVNYLNQNPDFGRPLGAAWKGENFITAYPTGYKLVVTPALEVYALDPEGTRAPRSFKIYPAPDVRRINLDYIITHQE